MSPPPQNVETLGGIPELHSGRFNPQVADDARSSRPFSYVALIVNVAVAEYAPVS